MPRLAASTPSASTTAASSLASLVPAPGPRPAPSWPCSRPTALSPSWPLARCRRPRFWAGSPPISTASSSSPMTGSRTSAPASHPPRSPRRPPRRTSPRRAHLHRHPLPRRQPPFLTSPATLHGEAPAFMPPGPRRLVPNAGLRPAFGTRRLVIPGEPRGVGFGSPGGGGRVKGCHGSEGWGRALNGARAGVRRCSGPRPTRRPGRGWRGGRS